MSSAHDQLISLVSTYQVPQAAKQLLDRQLPIVLCGITAAGKDTLAKELVAEGGFEKTISHTTRPPRANHGVMEEHGKDYFFVDEPTMLDMVSRQEFVEAKPVHDWVYGTGIAAYKALLDRGNRPLFVIDVQGAVELVAAMPQLRPIFLLPPTIAVWEQRLESRGKLDDTTLRPRMESAVKEIETIMANTAFEVVVNHDKAETARLLKKGSIGRDPGAVAVAEKLIEDIQNWLGSH